MDSSAQKLFILRAKVLKGQTSFFGGGKGKRRVEEEEVCVRVHAVFGSTLKTMFQTKRRGFSPWTPQKRVRMDLNYEVRWAGTAKRKTPHANTKEEASFPSAVNEPVLQLQTGPLEASLAGA